MQIPILVGREIDERDKPGSPLVAVRASRAHLRAIPGSREDGDSAAINGSL